MGLSWMAWTWETAAFFFRDLCAATVPSNLEYLRYEWRTRGGWRLAMAIGTPCLRSRSTGGKRVSCRK